MKKLATFIGLALVMLTTSCSQDVTTDVTPTTKVTLGLSIDATRTYIGGQAGNQYEVLWSEGDKIAVNGVEVAVPAQFVGKSNLEFAVDAAEEYNIAYPAEAVKDNVLTISEVQKFVDGSFAVGSGVLVGYTTTEKATLKNLYGFIKFTVSGAANVNAVTVTAEGGEAISGTFAVDYKNATISPLAGKDIIRVTDVKAAEGKATVVVAVPAGEYAEGFSVKVKDNANGVMTKSLKGTGATVEAGVVYSLPEVAYAATAKEVVIMTAEDLAAFATAANTPVEVAEGETAPCPYADWVSEDGEVKLGADIDMTDVDFTPIASFDGVFNGQGYAIKNWNATQGLFTQNYGVVKNVVIDESCTLTVAFTGEGDKSAAFIADRVEVTGLVAGCVNNGSVSSEDVSCAGHRIAGVVGASYGKVKDCVNNGDITIRSEEVNNGMNIAGVVAYINPNASTKDALGQTLVENCINNGKVDVYFNCTTSKANVGGVVGSTQNHGLATTDSTSEKATSKENHKVVMLGTIKNCINNGEVSYGFATLNSGTYGNIGGIIGYAECDIEYCDNHGNVSYVLAADDNSVSATCPSCAGVVGKNIFNVKNCNNYGEVNVAGVWAAGTAGAALAGGIYQAVFGGVAGYIGVAPYNKDGIIVVVPEAVVEADPKVENCNNYGKVTILNKCKAGGGTQGFLGGVIGGAAVPVEKCANHGEVNISSHTARVWMGGVLGYSISDAKELANHGKVTLTIDELSKASAGAQQLGGVIGQAMNIDKCVNNGEVVLKCDAELDLGGDLYAGGVAGYANVSVTNCELNSNVTLTVNTNKPANVKFAGVVGQVKTISGDAQPIDNCTSAEGTKVTLKTKAKGCNNFVGGIIAQSNNGVKDCVNKAAVECEWLVENTGSKGCAVAGVAALQKQVASGCSNEGSVTIKMNNSTCFLYAAGVVANHSGSMSDCSNSGNIVITDYAAADSETSFYGGLAAKATGTVADDCTNTGVVTLNGETL